MQINCKKCGAEIPAENVNVERLIAKCSKCNSVFSFADSFGDAERAQSVRRLNVPMPERFKMENVGSDLKITRRWFSWIFVALTFFAIFWNGFMAVWFGMAISQGIWIMALFGLLHGGIGIVLLYYVLSGYLNKTVVTVNRQSLEIKHGPLPYPGKKLNSVDIKQLYCKERVSRSSKGSISYNYEVHAVARDGKDRKLLTGLGGSDQALFVEQEIERFLRIEDKPVAGELSR